MSKKPEKLARWRSRWRSRVTTSRHNRVTEWLVTTSSALVFYLLVARFHWSPTEIGTKKSSFQSLSRIISSPFKDHFNPFQGSFQAHSRTISSPFKDHFKPIQGPFQAHSRTISSPLKDHFKPIHGSFQCYTRLINLSFGSSRQVSVVTNWDRDEKSSFQYHSWIISVSFAHFLLMLSICSSTCIKLKILQ